MGVQLLYKVVLVSAVQQSESATHVHIFPLFWISLLFMSPQSLEQSSLCSTVGSHQLLILYIVSVLVSQFIPLSLFSLATCTYVCLYLCVSSFALHLSSSVLFFQIPYVSDSIQYLFFFLTSLYMTVSRSIHISASYTISFLFMANILFHVYGPHLLIHSRSPATSARLAQSPSVSYRYPCMYVCESCPRALWRSHRPEPL